jgi:cytochrome c peroxidase
MHNGAFVRLEDAIRYHLDAARQAESYAPGQLPTDLRGALGPISPVLARLDPALRTPVALSDAEFDALVDFVRNGLLDPAADPARLWRLVPKRLPSGRASLQFEFP